MSRVIDLFAGPGGWDVAARSLGMDTIGIEWDRDACATRAAAGLPTIRADLYNYPIQQCDGLIASPPCPAFSLAGNRAGIPDLDALCDRIGLADPPPREWGDPTSALVERVGQWIFGSGCEWVALEQVPAVLPVWEALRRVLLSRGWRSAWCGVLNTANYGIVVPCPLHDTKSTPTENADAAAMRYQLATGPGYVPGSVTTPSDAGQTNDAALVVAHLGKAIAQACAEDATCAKRADTLAALLASPAQTTTSGSAGDSWTDVGMSECGWTADICENIGSWLSNKWAELYDAGKLSTTSTAPQTTTIQRIWKCIAATLTTSPHTGPARFKAGCGLCVDDGVPQTRRRAILIAHRTRIVHPPTVTHDADPQPTLFGEPLAPWVTMADALGWTGKVGFPRRDDLGTSPDGYRERDWFGTDGPSQAVTEKTRSWVLDTRRDQREDGSTQQRDLDQPAPAVTGADTQWVWKRPAGSESVKVTVEDAAALQSFPVGYPWRGSQTSRFAQVGNAFPPGAARAVLEAVVGWPIGEPADVSSASNR